MCVYICVCVHVESEVSLYSQAPTPMLFETGSLTEPWASPIRLGWPASSPRDPPVSGSTVLGLQTCVATPIFSMGVEAGPQVLMPRGLYRLCALGPL